MKSELGLSWGECNFTPYNFPCSGLWLLCLRFGKTYCYSQAFQQVATQLCTVLDRLIIGTMRVGAGTDEQVMFLRIVKKHGDLFGCVCRIINLQTIDGHLLAQLVEQSDIVAMQPVQGTTWMGNNADSSTLMNCINHFGNIVCLKIKTRFL